MNNSLPLLKIKDMVKNKTPEQILVENNDWSEIFDEELFKALDRREAELREKYFIRPLTNRRKKLYSIATEVFRESVTPKN